ncbi:MAG: hypothetical protein K2X48_10790 [Chitinophagaceae bacterium]|nr:hypothetical protein [Chitinophagaceae bacterium]
MKWNKQLIYTLVALVIVAALYRIIPNRPLGFAPQIAMALFAGSVIKDRKYSFALPLLSMLLSDILFQFLYNAGISSIPGFYSGQWLNYLLFAGLTVIGFFINQNKIVQIGLGALAAPTLFFFISNFLVWIGGGGFHHPKTVAGLIQTYVDGIPFYSGSLMATIVFAAILFGGYAILGQKKTQTAH